MRDQDFSVRADEQAPEGLSMVNDADRIWIGRAVAAQGR